MKKRGFLFIETVVVLVVAMIIVVGLFSSYSIINKNAENKDRYDTINEVYKANVIKYLMTSQAAFGSYKVLSSTNCSSNLNSDCSTIINKLNIKSVILTNQNLNTLLNSEPSDLSNTLKEYMSTLAKNQQYIIIYSVEEDGEYFASLSTGAL